MTEPVVVRGLGVQRLDHLGIVVGLHEETGLAAYRDRSALRAPQKTGEAPPDGLEQQKLECAPDDESGYDHRPSIVGMVQSLEERRHDCGTAQYDSELEQGRQRSSERESGKVGSLPNHVPRKN